MTRAHPAACPSCGRLNLGYIPGEVIVCGARDEAGRRAHNAFAERKRLPTRPRLAAGCGAEYTRPAGRLAGGVSSGRTASRVTVSAVAPQGGITP
jgi:hypothetical protein